MTRRFPPPWSAQPMPGGFRVDDADGQAVAYTYGDDRPKGASDPGMSRDEARRIAVPVRKSRRR